MVLVLIVVVGVKVMVVFLLVCFFVLKLGKNWVMGWRLRWGVCGLFVVVMLFVKVVLLVGLCNFLLLFLSFL